MADEARKKDLDQFDKIVKALSAAIKSSALYPSGHPSLTASLATLRQSLEPWIATNGSFDLGITPDNLLSKGAYVKKDPDHLYAEVGGYLHQRGLISLSVKPGVTDEELGRFFGLIKADPKTYASQGAIARQISSCQHLAVREVDYSALLKAGAGESGIDREKDVWQNLVTIAGIGSGEELPVSKVKFLSDFLDNPERSADVLNKVYKEALARVDDNASVDKMRTALQGIARYFDEHAGREGNARKDIADLILRLDPGLIAKLFEGGSSGGPGAAFSDDIMGALPDDTIADFIASLVGREGAVTSRLLKFFDKLVQDDHRAGNMTALVADKIFELKFLDREGLSKLQGSIKDMFKTDPGSQFLSEMYKMTIETFVDASVGAAYRSDEELRISREASEALKYDSLQRQEVRLLLNLIALEQDGPTFTRLCEMLGKRFVEIIDVLYIQAVRETYELFLQRLDMRSRTERAFSDAVAAVVDLITSVEILGKIIALIRDGGPFELNNISRIIAMTQPTSSRLLAEAYAREADEMARDRYAHVITTIGIAVAGELRKCMEEDAAAHPAAVMGMFDLVKRIDPAEAQATMRMLLALKNDRIKMEVLRDFSPQTRGDADLLLATMREAEGGELGERALGALLKSRSQEVVDALFAALRRGPVARTYLVQVVKLCGDLKVQEAEKALVDIFLHKPFFYTKKVDDIRVACLVALAQLGTERSMELVRRALRDRSDAVRRMSAILAELGAQSRTAKGEEKSHG